MAIEPKDALDVVAAAKNSWQWIAGGVASGVYGVWKYINRRIEKVEVAILEHQKTLVTSADLDTHTTGEDKKFEKLFEYHDGMNGQLSEIAKSVAVIGDNVAQIRDRQKINEKDIRTLQEDVAMLKERHRLEEHDLGRRGYDKT